MYRSLSNYLLLPWPNLPDNGQEWEMRAGHHATFLKQLFSKYLQLENAKTLSENKLMQEQGKIFQIILVHE